MNVAVLYARSNSIYKRMPGCDVWDKSRDARRYSDPFPVVAHPPCRAWGRLKGFAKPEPGERELALSAVQVVRNNGGVLEHPQGSTLWKEAGLPTPAGGLDEYGGYTLLINQSDFGHRAIKATWLYIVGCPVANLPARPGDWRIPDREVEQLSRAAREATPADLAIWLVETARRSVDLARPVPKSQVDRGSQVNPGSTWPAQLQLI